MATIDPPSGQTALTDLPTYGGSGGGTQAQQYYAGQQFKKIFGRNPTQTELDMLAPSYYGGDNNIANLSGGNAAIAGYFNSLSNSPTNIAADQQKKALDAYNQNTGQFDSQTNSTFQSLLGRNASSDEAQHFGALLASGQVDQYGLSQLLGQSQEAQQRQTQNYQDTLSKNLQGTQGDYFKNYIEPQILAQTAMTGRDPNSSGVQQAEVQAGKQQNYDLQNYLAQFGAGQYGQSAANQQNVYQQYLGNLYGLQNADVTNQLQQQNYMQQNNTNLSNMQTQQNLYNQYLGRYGKQSGNALMGGLQGGLSGAAAGFSVGGPWGALAGGVAGAGLGAYGASQGQGGAVPGMAGTAGYLGGSGANWYNRTPSGGGYGAGPSQGSNYYNGTNNNPSNYGVYVH